VPLVPLVPLLLVVPLVRVQLQVLVLPQLVLVLP
jgi:hypothetical protein